MDCLYQAGITTFLRCSGGPGRIPLPAAGGRSPWKIKEPAPPLYHIPRVTRGEKTRLMWLTPLRHTDCDWGVVFREVVFPEFRFRILSDQLTHLGHVAVLTTVVLWGICDAETASVAPFELICPPPPKKRNNTRKRWRKVQCGLGRTGAVVRGRHWGGAGVGLQYLRYDMIRLLYSV